MPSYNGVRWLGPTLASLQAQTMPDFEVVVVDDGSDAPTLDLLSAKAAADPRIKVYREAHAGLIATLNKTVAYARATYVARLDHDDIALPERLARQMAFLDSHPDHLAVGCDLAIIDTEGRILKDMKKRAKPEPHTPLGFPPKPMWMPGPTLFARKAAIERVGGFRPVCFAAEDRDMCWRLAAMGPTDRIQETLVHWRDHGANTSTTRYRTQMASHAVGDLSAIARALGLDDTPILADVVVGGDYRPILARYEALIGDRYPVRTWWYYFLMRYRAWQLHGLATDADVLREIRRHCLKNPLDWRRLKVLRRSMIFARRDREDARERSL
jgi:glycosyltransferase involved in cell wall biosynthesis